MKQDPSSAFVNITGSVYVSITLILGIFLAVSFSNEKKTNVLSEGPDPNMYWDESSCRCLSEEEPEPKNTVFLQAGYVSSEIFSRRYLSR